MRRFVISHIDSEPSFRTLLSFLSSENSSEAIQDDIMGILGYDPAAFELVTELFSPGMREGVVQYGRSIHLNPEAGVFIPGSSSNNNPDTSGPLRTHEEGLSFIEAQLEANAARPLFSGTNGAIPEAIQYPNVYTSASGSAMSSYGGRLALPMGTIRKEKDVSSMVLSCDFADSKTKLTTSAIFSMQSAFGRSHHSPSQPSPTQTIGTPACCHQFPWTIGRRLFPWVRFSQQNPKYRPKVRDGDQREYARLRSYWSRKDRCCHHDDLAGPLAEPPNTHPITARPKFSQKGRFQSHLRGSHEGACGGNYEENWETSRMAWNSSKGVDGRYAIDAEGDWGDSGHHYDSGEVGCGDTKTDRRGRAGLRKHSLITKSRRLAD